MRSHLRTVSLPHRWANLPTWFFATNVVGIAVSWTLFVLIRFSRGPEIIFLVIAAWAAFVAHFLIVALPSLHQVLFAERVSPLQRLLGLALTSAGLAGAFFAAFSVWWWW